MKGASERRGIPAPRLEPSGSERSHEPQSRSFNFSKKSTNPTKEERLRTAAAEPAVFTEGMREEFSADASDGTLLQRGVSATSAAVVAMEERAAVPAVDEWPTETPTTKRTLPATSRAVWTTGGWRGSRARVITIDPSKNIFSAIRVIVRAVMGCFNGAGVRRCSGSARASASARWSGFWSGSGVGGCAEAQGAVALGLAIGPHAGPRRCGYERRGECLAILSCLKVQLRFDMPTRGRETGRSNRSGLFRVSLLPNGWEGDPACCTGLETRRKN